MLVLHTAIEDVEKKPDRLLQKKMITPVMLTIMAALIACVRKSRKVESMCRFLNWAQ